MKARCISRGKYDITAGKIYEVDDNGSNYYDFINDRGFSSSAFKSRFELIEEEKSVANKYLIIHYNNGITADSLTTTDAIEAIEYIKSKDEAHKAMKYIQENFENAVFDIQPDGNKVKIKVTIGDYVLTN